MVRYRLVAGGGGHDEQQGVACLLSHGAVPVDEGHQQGEDEQVGRALLDGCCPEQHLQDHRLPSHGHTHLGGGGGDQVRATARFKRIKKGQWVIV